MKKLIASLLLLATYAVAQPTYDMTADVNYPDRKLQPLTFLQGSTPKLRVYIEQAGSTFTNIASDSLVFYYGTSGNASAFVQVTNSSVVATSGYFIVDFTAANLNTNGSFWYTVLLKDGSGGMYYSGDGELEIKKTTVTGSPGAVDLSTPLDWNGYVYSNAGDGPTIGDGTTITATTNAGGQLVLAAVNTGDITAVVAGTGLTGGGASGSVTVSQDSATIASLDLADSATQPTDSVTTLSDVTSAGSGAIITSGERTDIGLNTTHRSSNGSDHSYLDQDVTASASPDFVSVSADTMVMDAATDVTQGALTLNGTNYITWIVSGSSVTNLMPLAE